MATWYDNNNSSDLKIEYDSPDAVDKNGTLQDGHRGRVKLQMRDGATTAPCKACDGTGTMRAMAKGWATSEPFAFRCPECRGEGSVAATTRDAQLTDHLMRDQAWRQQSAGNRSGFRYADKAARQKVFDAIEEEEKKREQAWRGPSDAHAPAPGVDPAIQQNTGAGNPATDNRTLADKMKDHAIRMDTEINDAHAAYIDDITSAWLMGK